jgi:predicted DNA-binding antitoxin AbrB/MazE fold protein
MVREVDAVFEAGVLRPLEPLALSEHQRVRLTLDDQPLPQKASAVSAQHLRREEMLWLATEAGPYAGQWVALSGSRLIAHGEDAVTVRDAARSAGVERPLLIHLPEDAGLPFGGW